MGSWSATCGVTNLPIHEGHEVRVFFIREGKTPDGSDASYSNELWSPLTHGLKAEYNDYGTYEFTASEVEKELALNVIKQNLIELEVGENKYHDIAVKKEGFSLNKAVEATREGRLKINYPRTVRINDEVHGSMWTMKNIPTRLGIFVVHEFAYQAMMNRDQREMAAYIKPVDNSYIDKFIEQLVENCKETTEYKAMGLMNWINCDFSATRHPLCGILSRTSGMHLADLSSYTIEFLKLAKAEKFDAIREICLELNGYVDFLDNMNLMRKQFITQIGAGSQCEEYALHKLLLQKSLEHIEKDITDRDF